MEFDRVINNGTVIDGTGRRRFRADVGRCDGRIAAVAAGQSLTAHDTLDATGLIVTPGFDDAHSHADCILPLLEHPAILTPLLLQGLTTVTAGQCGFSPAHAHATGAGRDAPRAGARARRRRAGAVGRPGAF